MFEKQSCNYVIHMQSFFFNGESPGKNTLFILVLPITIFILITTTLFHFLKLPRTRRKKKEKKKKNYYNSSIENRVQ